MLKTEGNHWIGQLRTKWIICHLMARIAIALAMSSVLYSACVYFTLSMWTFTLLSTCILALCIWIQPVWKIKAHDITRYVNNKYPILEESADLFLATPHELNRLQRLQLSKIQGVLDTLPPNYDPLKKLGTGLLILLVGLLMNFGMMQLTRANTSTLSPTKMQDKQNIKEVIPAAISDFKVSITPPAYTGRKTRDQRQFFINAEIGSTVRWSIHTNVSVKHLSLIFNDKESISLKPLNQNATHFSYQTTVSHPGFYQLVLDGKKSDLYQIQVIADLPVNIKVNKPASHTTIDLGDPQRVLLNVSLADDYGIEDAYVSATMASGKGEGVSFTEKKLTFSEAIKGRQRIDLNKLIDLKSLGMKPGDELYFFVNAKDNKGQSSRSDIYFVSIVDTAELMSMVGMTNGVSLVPEYFRSQRQLIIDTEKLLKEKTTLTEAMFKTRSNDLGVDQKLLRLRYGKFLGEEEETEIGGEHHEDDGHDHAEGEAKFGDATAIMDKYAHKHDVAEDATYFEPGLKAQLKAVLTEMWQSELRLRTYKPQEALPFEYKALRLLKDLQQKSRAYVGKTVVKRAALKPEKRLTGELQDILQPIQKKSYEESDLKKASIQQAQAVLEKRKTGLKLSDDDKLVLGEAEKLLIISAGTYPGTYLQALTSLRRLSTSEKLLNRDIALVQQMLQKMMGTAYAQPQVKTSMPSSVLYQSYFNQLKKGAR